MLSVWMLTLCLLWPGVASQSWTVHDGKDCYAGRGAVALQPDPYHTRVTLDQCKAACVQAAAGVQAKACEGIVRKRSEGAGAGICYLRRAIAINQCAQDNMWTTYKVSRGGAPSGSGGWTQYGGVDCYQGRGGDPIQPDPYSSATTLSACQAACQANDQCQGVIRKASSGQGNGICYLRKNINYASCARDSTWDLYYKTGGGGGTNPRPRPVTPTTPDQILNAAISDNKVMIFSQTSCPWCVRAKTLFSQLRIPYQVIELDRRSDGPALRAALIRKTRQNTVPNIFINGRHIGGFDSIQALQARNQLVSTVNG